LRRIVLIVLVFSVLIATDVMAYDRKNERTIHLAKITKIDGYFCRGWITTTKTGRLIAFDNAAPIPLKNGVIPSYSRIVLYSNLNIQSAKLGKSTLIQGFYCIGHGPEGPAVSFYPDGNLKIFYINTDTWIQGILCHHGYFSKVMLYPNGNLRICELSKTQIIQGQKIKGRSVIYFDEKGKIIHIRNTYMIRSLIFDILDKII
jgi:hypothetical protein